MDVANCIFCKIAAKQDTKTEILYEDDKVVVFGDIKPASKFHFLVITRQHIRNAAQLKQEDMPLLNHMEKIGKEMIEKHEEKEINARMGFHCPPFNSINHLHLHVIFPVSQMGYFRKMIFPANKTPWFIPVDRLRAKIQVKPVNDSHL